ncbi:ATP-binding protein [Paenibacillus sp. FSL R5-0914]|uniref:ATP-binding protein n=1 Tax=Paenibacillus sp. FSL R5-0914 TaxID=2921665 RepID=UPI0030F58C70
MSTELKEKMLPYARPSFMGKRVKAEYYTSDEPNYCHNAFIEALPPIKTLEEAAIEMSRYPTINNQERLWPPHKRLHAVQRIASNFIEPMPKLLDLEQRMSRMIRNGYFARNPLSSEWIKQMRIAFDGLEQLTDDKLPIIRSSAAGFALIGTSGIGKTTAIETVLSLYPQVIEHVNYNGNHLIRQQLVWVKLECPRDGSMKALVLQFFQYVDAILGTNYYSKFCRSKKSAEDLIPDMSFLAANFGLGVLVIDEIQRLKSAASGGMKKMLDFITELTNSIGVPVMLIGTYGAMRPLTKLFSNARRASGQGDMTWSNYVQDEQWEHFIEVLWDYQWTNVPTKLTSEFIEVFYNESQGITDIAVKLYMIAQWSVIGQDDERLTPALIREVSKESLRLVRPVLDAMKSGDLAALERYEDVYPEMLDLEEFFVKNQERVSIAGVLNTLKNQREVVVNNRLEDEMSPELKIVQWLINLGVEETIAWEAAERTVDYNQANHDIGLELMMSAMELAKELKDKKNSKLRKKSSNVGNYKNDDLRRISNGVDSYESLKNANVIKENFE